MSIRFEHIGVTVSDMDRAVGFYCGLLGLKLALRKSTANGIGEMAFLDAGGGQLELVMPGVDTSTPAARPDPAIAGLRHITFAVPNLEETIERLEEAGISVIEQPRRAYASEMLEKVAFVLDPDGIVVELAQRAKGR